MTLKPGGYDWQFVPEAGRTFTDNGSDVCHDANGPVSGSGNPINTSLVTGTTYTDTPVTAGVAYNYTVTAVDNAGHESGPSNQASATADPPASGATGPRLRRGRRSRCARPGERSQQQHLHH